MQCVAISPKLLLSFENILFFYDISDYLHNIIGILCRLVDITVLYVTMGLPDT